MTTAPAAPDRHERRIRLVLGLWAVFLVVLIGFPSATRRALWTDELYSLATAEESVAEILRLTAAYQTGYFDHPPLYFIALRGALFWSATPLALRALSLLCGAALLALWSGEFRRQGLRPLEAAAACALIATHPQLAFLSTFARMYAPLALLLGGGAALLLFRLLETPCREEEGETAALSRRGWGHAAALGALLAAALYTSYHTAFLMAGLAILAAIWVLRPSLAGAPQGRSARWLLPAALALAALLAAPWAPTWLRLAGAEEGAGPPGSIPRMEQFVTEALSLGGGGPLGAVSLAGGWIALITFVPGAARRRWIALLAVFVIAPFALQALLLPAHRLVQVRYAIYAVPVALAGAAVGWAALGRSLALPAAWSRWIALLLLLAPVPFNAARLHSTFLREVPDWWAVAETLEREARPEEIILTGGYLSGEAVVYHLREPGRFSFQHYVTRYDEFLASCRDPRIVWYVNAAPLPPDFAAVVSQYFPWRAWLEGNGPGGRILLAAKKPFHLPGGAPAEGPDH